MRNSIAALMLLGLIGCAIAPRQDTPKVRNLNPSEPQPVGLSNFGIVAPGELYRGAQPRIDAQADGYATLVAQPLGIRTIVDLTNGPEDHWFTFRPSDCYRMTPSERQELQYIRLPTFEGSPSEEKLVEFLRIVMNPHNQPVFLHCSAGENRTGAMVAGYRIIAQNGSPEDAKAEMTHFGLRKIWQRTNDDFVDDVVHDREKLRRKVAEPSKDPVPARCP